MALVIDNPELEQVFVKLAEATGQSAEESVYEAVQEKLARVGSRRPHHIDLEVIRAIQDRVARRPFLNTATEDELLGYNERGLFD